MGGGTENSLTAHADTVANNVSQTQPVNSSASAQQNTNQVVLQTSSSSKNQQKGEINPSSNTTATNVYQNTINTSKEAVESQDDGLDPNIYGTVNASDWDYQKNNNILALTGYHGTYNHIVIPNLNDFNSIGVNMDGITQVGINSNTLHNILFDVKNPDEGLSIAISKTTGKYSNEVVAENSNWTGVFCPYQITYDNGKPGIANWNNLGFKLMNIDLSNLNTKNITSIAYMFALQMDLRNITGLGNWNTSNITNMASTFANCRSLNYADLKSWDTSKVTDMSVMFAVSGLRDLTMIQDWDTSKVTDMNYMFRDMGNLTALDLSKWNTGQVTNMSGMLSGLGLSSIDLSNLNTSKVTDMSAMFWGAIK